MLLNVNDDVFDELMVSRLKEDYKGLMIDLAFYDFAEQDVQWMKETAEAIKTLLSSYYMMRNDAELFLKEVDDFIKENVKVEK